MPLKMSVTQIRVLIIAVNLLLTVMLGGHAVYRLVYNREYTPEDKTLKKQLTLPEKVFQARKGGRTSNTSEILNIQGVASALSPPPVVVAEAPDVDPGREDPLPPVDPFNPVVEEGGPLEEKWEYVNRNLFPDNSELNRAILAQKSKAPKSRVRTRTVSTRTRTSTTRARTPIRRAATVRNTRVVHKYDRWEVDENEELTVWIVDVTDREMIYEEEGTWRRYKLVRKITDIWNRETNEVKAIEEEEDEGVAKEDSEEKKKSPFYLNRSLPDPAEVFANRKTATPPETTISTGGGSRVTNRHAATSTSRTAGASMTSAERRKQAIEKMRELKNLDRSKLSPDDRKGLQEVERLMEQGLRGKGRTRR